MKKIVLFLGLLFLSFGAWAQESSLSEEVTDDSLKIYSLGEVEVMGNRPGKLVSAKVTSAQLLEFNRTNVTEALNLLPGLSIT